MNRNHQDAASRKGTDKDTAREFANDLAAVLAKLASPAGPLLSPTDLATMLDDSPARPSKKPAKAKARRVVAR